MVQFSKVTLKRPLGAARIDNAKDDFEWATSVQGSR